MTRGWFITGTDTGVGKTLVTSAMLHVLAGKGERVVGMKPVASGCREVDGMLRSDDADSLIMAGSVAAGYDLVCPYRFVPAIAPHIAAMEAGRDIDIDIIVDNYRQLAQRADRVLVEGVGGWEVPLGERLSMADVAVELGLPVVIVVGARLGCINHALLTRQAVHARGLPLAGWVFNHIDPDMQRTVAVLDALRERMGSPLLGVVPHAQTPGHEEVAAFLGNV